MTKCLDIIHRLSLIKRTHDVSETGVCLCHQVKKDLALSVGPNRVGVLFYLMMETDSSLRNVVCFLIKDRRWIMSKKFVILECTYCQVKKPAAGSSGSVWLKNIYIILESWCTAWAWWLVAMTTYFDIVLCGITIYTTGLLFRQIIMWPQIGDLFW
jgi:hypothetical protein